MGTGARVSRRAALAGIGGIAATSILAACGGSSAATPTTAGKAPTTAAIVPQIVTPAVVAATTTSASAAAPTVPSASAVSVANPTTTSATVKRGGQLRIMQINDFVSMDPIFASGPTASACYDWLLAWRPNAQGQFAVQPLLAKSWDVSGNTIVFKIQENVKFHDG